jgi:hypothetical protein
MGRFAIHSGSLLAGRSVMAKIDPADADFLDAIPLLGVSIVGRD